MNAVSNILDGQQGDAPRPPFAAFMCDEISSQILHPLVVDRDWPADMVFAGGIAAGVRMLGGMACPEFMIVDLSESTDPRADMQSLADVCEAGTVVLAVGTINDVTLYRDLMNAGVHDYLVKPLTAEMLNEAIVTAQEAMMVTEVEDEPQDTSPGERTVFIGVRGGVGTSTLVSNVAWLLAERKEKTVLLDLDLYFGTSAMQFDLEPGRGLSDALENPDRVDGLFLERAVVKPHENLAILGSEAPVGSLQEPVNGSLQQLVGSLAENFKNVVVDVPRQMVGNHSDLLSAVKDIVLVTDYSLTAARDCIRLLAHIKQVSPNASVHVVASNITSTPQEVEQKDFENSIEHETDVTIPSDVKTLMASSQRSKLVVDDAATSKLALAYKDVLSAISAVDEDAEADDGWFSKLFKKSA